MRELTNKEFEAVAFKLAEYWNARERGSIFGKTRLEKKLAGIKSEIWRQASNISDAELEPYTLDNNKEQDFDSMVDSYCACYCRARYTADITFFRFGYTARQMERLIEGIIVASHKMRLD